MSKRKYTNSKESILEAAVRVLVREGARGFSTEAVIRESGLSKAGFFYNYKTKKELMLAVMKKLSEDWHKEISEIGAADPNPIGRSLRAHLKLSVKYYVDPSPEALAINKAFGEVYLLEPELFDESSDDQFIALFDKDEGLPPEQSNAIYLAINGFWMNEASNFYKMPASRKKKLLDLLIKMTEGPVQIDKTPIPKKKNKGGS